MNRSEMQRKHVIRMLFSSMADWDRGLDFGKAEDELWNARGNMAADSDGHESAAVYRKFYAMDKDRDETVLFDCLRKKYMNMRQPSAIVEEKVDDKVFLSLVKGVASKKNGRFAFCANASKGWAMLMTSRNFMPDRESQKTVEAERAVSRPAEELAKMIADQREKQKRLKEMQRRKSQKRAANAGRGK